MLLTREENRGQRKKLGKWDGNKGRYKQTEGKSAGGMAANNNQ